MCVCAFVCCLCVVSECECVCVCVCACVCVCVCVFVFVFVFVNDAQKFSSDLSKPTDIEDFLTCGDGWAWGTPSSLVLVCSKQNEKARRTP